MERCVDATVPCLAMAVFCHRFQVSPQNVALIPWVASYIPMNMIIELSRQHDKNLLVEQKMPVLPFLNDL